MSVIDTEIEVAEIIIKQDGDCCEKFHIDCCYCPAFRIYQEKGLSCCVELWDGYNDVKIKWFKNWLSEVKK